MTDSILLNDGTSFLLLNDGTSKLLLNAHVAPSVGGVDIVGTHAVADLRGIGAGRRKKKRIRAIGIIMDGRISRLIVIPSTSKIFQKVILELKSKIAKIINPRVEGKLWKSNHYETKARIDKTTSLDIRGKLPFSVYEKYLKKKLKESRLRKLKKLFDMYKEVEDE